MEPHTHFMQNNLFFIYILYILNYKTFNRITLVLTKKRAIKRSCSIELNSR